MQTIPAVVLQSHLPWLLPTECEQSCQTPKMTCFPFLASKCDAMHSRFNCRAIFTKVLFQNANKWRLFPHLQDLSRLRPALHVQHHGFEPPVEVLLLLPALPDVVLANVEEVASSVSQSVLVTKLQAIAACIQMLKI